MYSRAKNKYLIFFVLTLGIVHTVSADIILTPTEGMSFQGPEAPYTQDDTAEIYRLDGIWAPTSASGMYNYYATGSDSRFWDALSLKFDTGMYDPSNYNAVLRFYAQKGDYWNDQWHHYIVLPGEKNPTYQDIDYNQEPVKSDPKVHSIGNAGGSWSQEPLPDSFWNRGSFWVTLRLWNVRIDAVELWLAPKGVPSLTAIAQSRVLTNTGSLSVSSSPEGAKVYLDGIFEGVTPTEVSGLSAGSHTLLLTMNGYQDLSKEIAIEAGVTQKFSTGLQKVNQLPGFSILLALGSVCIVATACKKWRITAV